MEDLLSDRRQSILAIDDTPANLMMLGTLLSREYKLQIATSGARGLTLAAATRPDLILLDVMMPEMDGYETCRRLKADARLADIPVIFITALTDSAAETAGLALGAADFITKPINVEIARHRIRNLLERESLRKAVEDNNQTLELDIAVRKKVEETLRASEERYRLLVDTASEGILVAQDGRLQFVNPMIPQLTGYSRDELVGHEFLKFIHPDDRTLMMANYVKRLRGEDFGQRYPIRILTKTAGEKWIEISGARIDWQGRPATLNFVTDITERRQMENALKESELRYRTVADFTSDWEYWVMPDGSFRYISPSCKRVSGYDPEEFYADQELLRRLIHPDDLQLYAEHTHHISEDGVPVPIDFRIRTKDGQYRWLSHVCRHVVDPAGQDLGYRASNRDNTERKQVEEDLKRSNAELEQFSYAISHDMRQPLRMISSYLKLIETELADRLDTDQRGYFDFAIDGAKRLDQMMVGLLEYSRVGRKGEPPMWIESRAIVDEALLFLEPEIGEAAASVKIEGEWPRVFVSRDELMRLLQNLIGNAIKFRVAGQTPQICVTSANTGKHWQVCVADNGVGIVTGQIGRLFQVFQRLQSRAAYPGTGIGLALCRRIAEHHGGKIWAESPGENQGSRFCFSLPQDAPS